MARAGSTTESTTTRARRKTAAQKAAEAASTEAVATEPVESNAVTEAVPAEVVETVNTEATEEANPVSTDTVETEVIETPASDTTEATETATPEVDAEKAAAEAKAEQEYTDFEAAVATALDERDTSTGTVPDAQIEAVKEKYRVLNGAKFKNRAKNFLNEKLREAVAGQDIILGGAVMALHDAVQNAGPAPRQTAPRAVADPTSAFRDKMVVLHLAYALGRSHAPEGVEADAVMAEVETKVNELTEAADAYYTWATNTAEDKGDAPEVDPLVVKAVKASQLKAATRAASTGTSTPREPGAARRNVRTHIAQAFDKLGKGTGDVVKVSEIAKQATDEYPSADCSAGAISAALKSEKGVPGFALANDEAGHTAAKKL